MVFQCETTLMSGRIASLLKIFQMLDCLLVMIIELTDTDKCISSDLTWVSVAEFSVLTECLNLQS